MRALGLLLALAAAARAGAEEEIRALVEQLGSDEVAARQQAAARLARYGEALLPAVEGLEPADPEIRRFLRGLTRAARKLTLSLEAPGAPVPLGGPLVLEVVLVNGTEDSHYLPVTRTPTQGGTKSAFVVAHGDERVALSPDQVEYPAGTPAPLILRPGDSIRARITLTGEASPLRRPEKLELRVLYAARAQRWQAFVEREHALVREVDVELASEAAVVEGRGRTPEELERALAGEDAPARVLALAELRLREDDAILPVLRRHAADRDLRLAAVRRLGAHGNAQDFELVHDATRDPDARVRLAAVRALAHFDLRAARTRLIGLAQDHELGVAAIRALRRHESAVTIDLFVRLLRQRTADRESIDTMCDALYEWTGMPVTDRGTEIRAFERWWARNRARWARERERD